MRIEQLKYFVKIVECGSFNQAAEELFLTQPAVTSAIKSLESEVGAPLLLRRKKGVAPTRLGEQVYGDSKRLLNNLDQALAAWQDIAASQETGAVRVSAIPTICAYFTEHLLPELLASHPGIQITLDECEMMRFNSYLEAGERRLLLTSVPIKREARETAAWQRLGYAALPLLEDAYAIVLGAGHPLARHAQLSKKDCQSLNYCSYASDDDDQRSPLHQFLHELGKKPAIFLSSRETVTTHLLSNSLAIILLEKMMRYNHAVRAGNLVLRQYAEGALLPSRHYLVHLPLELLSEAEKSFVEFVSSSYARKFA